MNKIVRISLAGGLIGLLTTNPRGALERTITRANEEGWRTVQVVPHSDTNLFVLILKLAVLILTLGLWTWGAGYLVVLEKTR